MSFLYPLFLLAGLTIAIPVLIHLFNLRRYKVIHFPNVKFLQSLQLISQKQSKLRYRWLLAMRILFLLSLVLAFAQPFLRQNNVIENVNPLQIIFIDNAPTSSLKSGARTLLDLMKSTASEQLKQMHPETPVILLCHDQLNRPEILSPEKAMQKLQHITVAPYTEPPSRVFTTAESFVESYAYSGADVYFYSDFREGALPTFPDTNFLKQNRFFGIPFRTQEPFHNLYIDTAFLTDPVLYTDKPNRLVVKTIAAGNTEATLPSLQLSVNGQIKNVGTPQFSVSGVSMDTIPFSISENGWQEILLSIADGSIPYDDTFRISARHSPDLSVLVLNEGSPNPYLQAAFQSFSGFQTTQLPIDQYRISWEKYSLIVLQNITTISKPLAASIADALHAGKSICIFPGKTATISRINEGLNELWGIHISGTDTTSLTAGTLHAHNPLVQDLFEQIPENVQLPQARWHYQISAPIHANQQSIFSFHNGDPLFAQYTPAEGNLYICATPIDGSSGNFQSSYFFVPFLYKMAVQSRGSDIYALTSGNPRPIFVSHKTSEGLDMLHVYAEGMDIIPPQRPSGNGTEIFVAQVLQYPGYYKLASESTTDTTIIAINSSRAVSHPSFSDLTQLHKQWNGEHIIWQYKPLDTSPALWMQGSNFPLWKLCITLALVWLAAETLLLILGYTHKKTIASS